MTDPPFFTIGDHQIEYRWWNEPSGAGSSIDGPVAVFLHEGLGSIELWRDIPSRVAEATGLPVLAYSRYGYGQSTPFTEPRTVRYMHDEALDVLPQVLEAAGINDPILVGHSDGGSISLVYTGAGAGPVRAVAVLAPHVYVENICAAGITDIAAAAENSNMVAKLGRYHRDPEATFAGWRDIWLHPDFRAWDIREYLPTIEVPVLAMQGTADQYATTAMLDEIERLVSGPVEIGWLEGARHMAHRDTPDELVAALTRFIAHVTA
ncbi:MAG: alpha/beta hydrolase [Actinomycetia bacterium]|nr:alpha/beta hydrolase [Actinomycetes bacterium]